MTKLATNPAATAVRVRLTCVLGLAAAGYLAGCSNVDGADGPSPGTSANSPAAVTDSRPPGPAAGSAAVLGADFTPCTSLEIDAYPATIPRPSTLYYSGPWCRTDQSEVTYLWLYARPLESANTQDQVAQDVRVDAESITLDLSAQGYQRVCGVMEPGIRVDAAFEKPGQSVRIRVQAVAATATAAGPPDAVAVSISGSLREPAVADGSPGPAC